MQHRRIIKQGPIVLATGEDASIDPTATSSQGLFLADTRFLSRFQIRIDGMTPVLLGSSEETLFQSSFLMTNPELADVPARAIGILLLNTIGHPACGPSGVRTAITLVNWALKPVRLELSIEIDADFYDAFEARGVKRVKRGEMLPPRASDNCLEFEYIGLDGVSSTTLIETVPAMAAFENGRMLFPVALDAGARFTLQLMLQLKTHLPEGSHLVMGPEATGRLKPDWFDRATRMSTSNASVEAITNRSVDDLEILLTEFPDVWVPVAGLPRFTVPFGRDCLITGLETLSWNPCLSHDVLHFLAKRQGQEENPWNYEQPGKIMHEMHTGELARLKEVPFGLFYGSVDSTPLFLVLAGEYLRWTGDIECYRRLKPHLEAAWSWIDRYGDIDGSGYIQYQAHTPAAAGSAALSVGLFNQGWKDSSIAVAYGDGKMVTDHPIALAEVQGYLYRALVLWGELYLAMPQSEGRRALGHKLLARAQALKRQFNQEFWMPEKRYYAMALDGHHRPVDSITSNPGHCLWARLIDEEHADAMVETLISEPMMSAWGIRTMASTEPAYNPLSYHDGSIWPFENALIMAGLKKYGFVQETQRVFDAMVAASRYFEYRRWPEVFCGAGESIGGVLALQPDASRPQAWSSGAIFLLLQTWLGLAPRPFARHVDVTPALPASVREIVVDGMAVAGSRLSLRIVRADDSSSVLLEIRDNPDDLDIMIHPVSRSHHHAAPEPGASSRDTGYLG